MQLPARSARGRGVGVGGVERSAAKNEAVDTQFDQRPQTVDAVGGGAKDPELPHELRGDRTLLGTAQAAVLAHVISIVDALEDFPLPLRGGTDDGAVH